MEIDAKLLEAVVVHNSVRFPPPDKQKRYLSIFEFNTTHTQDDCIPRLLLKNKRHGYSIEQIETNTKQRNMRPAMVLLSSGMLPVAIAFAVVGVLVATAGTAEAFAWKPLVLSFLQQQQQSCALKPQSAHRTTTTTTTTLSALVYRVDGSVVEDDAFDNNDEIGGNRESEELAFLSREFGTETWASIACAFARPPHDKLTPGLVKNASPVGIRGDAIDVAVAVPASEQYGTKAAGNDQLVRVLVSVGFPQAWAIGDNDTPGGRCSALAEQVRILEGHAGDKLAERGVGAAAGNGSGRDDPGYYERLVVENRRRERLEEEPSPEEEQSSLPEWWQPVLPPAATIEMLDEAKLLKKLLNEDEFEDELRALFVRERQRRDGESPVVAVLRAAVASIGFSGLCLRARICGSGEEENGGEILATVVVPYQTGDKSSVGTVGELREAVLVLVESVDPLPAPEPVRASSESAATTTTSAATTAETIQPFNERVVREVTAVLVEEDNDGEEPGASTEEPGTIGDDDETGVAAAAACTSSSSRGTPQPRPPKEEAELAAKYAAIEGLGDRAFAILRDLGMLQG